MPQRITGHTELIGLIATPIRHSKSPMMHNTAFEALGLDYVYLAFDIQHEQLDGVVKGLKALGIRGFNVSMPYKTEVMNYLDVVDDSAKLIGACNTVVNENGKFYGYNTDGMGYMAGLRDNGYDPTGKKITVLGSGGAATAIVMQAALDGVAEISIFNGDDPFYARAEHNAQVINENTGCKATVYKLEDTARLKQEIAESYILANATNVGMGAMEGQKLIPDESYLRPDLIVTDVIYSPEETALLKMAREFGCRTMNGLPMMLFQGAAAFKLWTGKDMPIDAVKAVI
jgi:shikimate dehydrogenase